MARLNLFFIFAPISFFILFPEGSAQYSGKPDPDDFYLGGDALKTGSNCFRLTSANNWSGGSIWYKTPIDLTAPFEMEIDMMLGCKDAEGADGMVLVFHPRRARTGYQGEGMGFAGLQPSLGIEIDTWENEHLGDPPHDHVAILRDGFMSHFYNLAGPVVIPNIEDCREHRVKINWAATSKTLTLAIDGREVITYRGDIVREVFEGNGKVYWGITAGTGQYNNRHEICLEKLSFKKVEPLPRLDPRDEQRLKSGLGLIFNRLQFPAGQTEPSTEGLQELDKIAFFLQQNPDLGVEVAAFTDSSGSESQNKRLSRQRADAIAAYLIRKGIDRKRIYSFGYGEARPLASNETPEGRAANRRIEFRTFRLVP